MNMVKLHNRCGDVVIVNLDLVETISTDTNNGITYIDFVSGEEICVKEPYPNILLALSEGKENA